MRLSNNGQPIVRAEYHLHHWANVMIYGLHGDDCKDRHRSMETRPPFSTEPSLLISLESVIGRKSCRFAAQPC